MPRAIERFAFPDRSTEDADLEVDAERLYALSQAYRNDKRESRDVHGPQHACAEISGKQWNEKA